jgi:hypothetical protein
MAHHLGERRHRADLHAAVQLVDAAQVGDLAEVDDHLGPLEAILQPVHAVETAGQDQGVGAVPLEQLQRIVHARRLVELECRNDVANHGHIRVLT